MNTGHRPSSASSVGSWGTASSRTMIVMMIARTPPLNASSLPLLNRFLHAAAIARCRRVCRVGGHEMAAGPERDTGGHRGRAAPGTEDGPGSDTAYFDAPAGSLPVAIWTASCA